MPRAVILTALPVEYLAVRKHLTELEEKENSQGTIYEQGKYVAKRQEWEVRIAEVGTGNTVAAIETVRAIADFQPDILLFVGIAGGIKDVAIGDVVVATEVYDYESGKVQEQFFPRPKAGKSAYALVQRAKSEARKGEWLQRLDSTPVPQPRVFVVPIVTGEKVIASRTSDIFQFMRESYNDAIALDMEGFGFLSAAFAYPDMQAVVIRGISDLIEGKNDDSVEPENIRQLKASQHASAFAFEVLSKLKIISLPQSTVPRVTQEAFVDYNRVLEINYKDAEAYSNRGVAYSNQGELYLAIADYNRALKINPEDADTYCNRGNAYCKQGELDLAIADYTQALKINPENAFVYNNRGLAYGKKGELDLAIADFNLALNINPEDAEAYNNRGIVYYYKGELDLAIAGFNLALNINPEDAEAYNNRGLVYYHKGELDLAIADFNLALQFNPEDADAYFMRGSTYFDLGNKQKTIQDLKKAAKLHAEQGDTANQKQVLEALKELQKD